MVPDLNPDLQLGIPDEVNGCCTITSVSHIEYRSKDDCSLQKKTKNSLSKTPFHISIGPYAQDQKEIVLYLKEITLGENHIWS